MRKVIAFDDETHQALVQLGRDRMATLQELADEAFADLLKKHGVPIDLKDALRKSAGPLSRPEPGKQRSVQRNERELLRPQNSRRHVTNASGCLQMCTLMLYAYSLSLHPP